MQQPSLPEPFDRRPTREEAHKALDLLMDTIEDADQLPILSGTAVQDAARLAGWLCGPALIERVYGSVADPTDRETALYRLASRLTLAANLFHVFDNADDSGSIRSAAREASDIASGAEPGMFSQVSARKVNVRVIEWQCRALEWSVYLEALGLSAAERQQHIVAAYGFTWDTISRWEKGVRRVLSPEMLRVRLSNAKQFGHLSALSKQESGEEQPCMLLPPLAPSWQPSDEASPKEPVPWKGQLAAEGEAFKRAMGFTTFG